MRKSNSYVVKVVLATMLVLIGSEWFSKITAQAPNDDPYEVVMRLFGEFNQSANVSALESLANMVRNDRFGPDAGRSNFFSVN
jgi:hypothetical protein